MTTPDTLYSSSGLKLLIEPRLAPGGVELSLSLEGDRECVLHWGLRVGPGSVWQAPPSVAWPAGTKAFDRHAVRTPFPPAGADRRLVIRLDAPLAFDALDFVLFLPDRQRWDNNGGKNFSIPLPRAGRSPAALAETLARLVAETKPTFQRTCDLGAEGRLAIALTEHEDRFRCVILCDVPGPLLLHWGIARHSSNDWLLPPESMRPPGTTMVPGATQTLFTARGEGVSELRLEFASAEAPLGVQFVLKQVETGRWFKDRGGNFYVPIRNAAPRDTGLEAPELAAIAHDIIQSESARGSVTLMHRFNLAHDLLERVRHNAEGLAMIFVWLRFSAIRQLTWQRNYNTKPRELSHAQERLTGKLAETYRLLPASRPLTRLLLGTVGRGGEGQRIRDEILVIMHRHHIKEVCGHFMEEWHQKLHNNTTPDDIVICEAYLEFLRSDGRLERFYEHCQAAGVTRARLESFERPIRTAPDFIPHLKHALLHDFEHYLRVLKSVHAGTDLETAMNNARPTLDHDTQRLLGEIWHQRGDARVPLVQLVERITEARRRLREALGRGGREVLYLDLALEQFLRTVIERNIHLDLSGDQLVDLVARVLENLILSEAGGEFDLCLSHWEKLRAQPRFTREWSLHAKAVLDRAGRVLGGLIDQGYRLLQPKAELLGHAFHAEEWTITLFSEEVVRGNSLGFVLSMLLHHLDPRLRKAAQLGHWQVISRGSGSGRVELVETLRSIQGKPFDTPTIILADKVNGDEEVPPGVTAVIAPDVTDIVSHVAVRARNAQLLFATCYDADTFAKLKALRGQWLRVEVSGAGDLVWEQGGGGSHPVAVGAERRLRALGARPKFSRFALTAAEFTERNVGGKSFNQARLRGCLPDWVKQPVSVALPFGVCEHVLGLAANRSLAARYHALAAQAKGIGQEKTLGELREVLLDLPAPDGLRDALHESMQQAGLPPPEDWPRAWTCLKRVWASKWNERAFLSREANGIAHDDLFMAVLVQQVVEADYAFVIHTVNPVTGNAEELYAEVVLGLGETLVGNYPGRALSFTWDKRHHRATLLAYPGKSTGLHGGGLIFRSDSNGEDLAGYAGAGLYDSVLLNEPRAVTLDYANERLVWDAAFRHDLLEQIAEAGLAVAEVAGSPQDIEGAFSRGQCYIVQTRPQVGATAD